MFKLAYKTNIHCLKRQCNKMLIGNNPLTNIVLFHINVVKMKIEKCGKIWFIYFLTEC